MTTWADNWPGKEGRYDVAPQNIDTVGNWLKMLGPNAGMYTTEVIELQAMRDWADH